MITLSMLEGAAQPGYPKGTTRRLERDSADRSPGETNMPTLPRWGLPAQSTLVLVASPISHTCLFLPRILMSWTFLRETSWQSSWKGKMAGGLWNEMDNVALSLGRTWRSSEERPVVPTYLCPDCEVRTVPITAWASRSQNQGWPRWGWDGYWLLSINFSQE